MNRNIFALIFLLILLYLFYLIFKPFLIPLIWAGIVAIVLHPPYRYCVKKLRNKDSLIALLFSIGVLLIIVLPSFSILFMLVQETMDAYNKYKDVLANIEMTQILERIKEYIPEPFIKIIPSLNGDSDSLFARFASVITEFLLHQAQGILKNTGVLIFRLIIMIAGIFFFLKNGKVLVDFTKKILPFDGETREVLLSRLNETVTAVLTGMIITSMVQGFLLGVGFLIFGVPFPVLFGALTFLLTLLPFGGAIPVWLWGAIFLFLNGKIGAGVGLLLWGALLVSSIDNFLKPFLIGERTNIPFFLLFLSLLGGIMAFGLTGLLLGPVIVAVFLSLLNVYTELIQVRGK